MNGTYRVLKKKRARRDKPEQCDVASPFIRTAMMCLRCDPPSHFPASFPSPSPAAAAVLRTQSQRDLERNARLAKNEFDRRSPVVIEEHGSFSVEHFAVPHHYKDDVKEIMIPFGLVNDRHVVIKTA